MSLLQDNGNVRSVSCNLFLQCLIAEAGYNQSTVFICRQLELEFAVVMVIVPDGIPSILIVAPIIGSLRASSTVPEMVRDV